MGVEVEIQQAEVRVVRCDRLVTNVDTGITEFGCDSRTASFVDITEQNAGVMLLDSTWIQVRFGVTSVKYFCGWEHAAEWIATGRLLPQLGYGLPASEGAQDARKPG